MKKIRQQGPSGLEALERHRDSFVSLADFERIRSFGLNAVRIPFGYWIVLGSSHDDPYHGPSLQHLDRAVQWAEQTGLQVLLDLHGCPGGESAEAPCGRRQRPLGQWHWSHWRFDETLQAIRVVAERYCHSPAITGIAVCNEPSPTVPSEILSRFYSKAVRLIRRSGMTADRITIVLPVFQRPLAPFAAAWAKMAKHHRTRKVTPASHLGKFAQRFAMRRQAPLPSTQSLDFEDNVCFEVHWYHCFENEWHGRTFAQHLRAVQEHNRELRRYPVVVGEWSLALGCGVQPGRLSLGEMRALFAHAQLAAYREASHGWFFWTWSDSHGVEWDWQRSMRQGLLPPAETLKRGLPELPPLAAPAQSSGLPRNCEEPCMSPAPTTPKKAPTLAQNRASPVSILSPRLLAKATKAAAEGLALGLAPSMVALVASTPPSPRSRRRSLGKNQALPELDDPLEAMFDTPASDPFVRLGDTIYLRTFHGRYYDVERSQVKARYADRGLWQQFVVCPFGGTLPSRRGSCGACRCALKRARSPRNSSSSKASSSLRVTSCPCVVAQQPTGDQPLRDGHVVSLQVGHTGCYLGVQGRKVLAKWEAADARPCAFVVRTLEGIHLALDEEGAADGPEGVDLNIRHRTAIFLQSYSTQRVLAPNEGGPHEGARPSRDLVLALWKDFGSWQRLTVEKPLCAAVTPRRPRRRSSVTAPPPDLEEPEAAGAPVKRRRSSVGGDGKRARNR